MTSQTLKLWSTGFSLQVAGLRAEAKEREERMSKLEKKIRDVTKR